MCSSFCWVGLGWVGLLLEGLELMVVSCIRHRRSLLWKRGEESDGGVWYTVFYYSVTLQNGVRILVLTKRRRWNV